MNTTMPVTLASLRSYPEERSISSGSWPPGTCSLCLGMFGLQNLRQMRIVDLHKGPRLQSRAEVSQPETEQRGRHGDVLENSPAEMQIARGIFEVGLDEPEHIESAGKDHPLADAQQALLVALEVARKQHAERNHPVEEEVERDDNAPAAANTIEIPVDFAGQVA